MVAPTRTPHARGAKCDVCKKILAAATWLDQTKLAKEVEEAEYVLSLIKQHNTLDCPCIPKNIENLLVGSTHFEIHRLTAKKLDSLIFRRQYESTVQSKQKAQSETSKNNNKVLNDCDDRSRRDSRFKTYSGYSDLHQELEQQFRHLCRAIDSWRLAMEDQTHPFNAKLALRLGLTHHVIYACYLFKYYKVLDYQLITANLLINIFKSIEGVTANAILHAYFLLIKSLIDCDQLQLARYHLKQATKMSNYHDKSLYESILLTCVACELRLLDGRDGTKNTLDELSELVYIKQDDKLQHYYARTLAMTVIIRFIHIYPSKSDNCCEFFHAFRFICAIIRRCYESSFEIVLAERDVYRKLTTQGAQNKTQVQILDHNWIRFAVCDFVYSTFDLLSEFYSRAGMPECLELIYNALALISFRNGGLYWQSRILNIGAKLDLLCDRYESARAKVDISSRIVGQSDDPHLMNIIRLYSEVGQLQIDNQQQSVITKNVIDHILDRVRTCKRSLLQRLAKFEIYDVKTGSFLKVSSSDVSYEYLVICGYLGNISLTALSVGVESSLRQTHNYSSDLISILRGQLGMMENMTLEYYTSQYILVKAIQNAGAGQSKQTLLDTLPLSSIFMEIDDKSLDIQSQLSSLTLNSETDRTTNQPSGETKKSSKITKKASRIPLGRRSKRKGTYEVAIRSEENLCSKQAVRLLNVIDTMSNFTSLSKEEMVVSYLRNTEPNPDYHLYRCAHELMLCYRLSDEIHDPEAILYHLSESVTANTLRYRWMMYEEQQSTPFDHSSSSANARGDVESSRTIGSTKHLGFSNSLVNHTNVLKSMTRAIPDDTRLVQLKYIHDTRLNLEHLLCVALSQNNDSIYVHARRSLSSDEFFNDAAQLENNTAPFTIPNRLATKIEESKQSLLNGNHRARTETRKEIESSLGVILHDAENDWLGPFRFLLCGRILDPSYNNFINCLACDVTSTMGDRLCRSPIALKMLLEYAPILRRDEFCQALGTLFNCSSDLDETRDCFNKWLKSMEAYMKEHNMEMNKTAFLMQLERGQVGLVLDNKLELIPFESLPVVKTLGQGIFRVPSLRLFTIMATKRCSPIKIDINETAYILDPADNLAKTRDRFECKLRDQKNWIGTIGYPPDSDDLEDWLSSRQLYIFIGHGAGTVYYNKLCKSRGLGYMNQIESAAIVMGCSSGRMMSEGPRLETFGIGWLFIFHGAPCYLGLLWDVTDCDIDKYLDELLDRWMPNSKWSSAVMHNNKIPLTTASTFARNVCQLKLLVGSSPIIYGLPIWCKD